MKKILYTTLLILSAGHVSFSQTYCAIDVTPLTATICPGDSVYINAFANLVNNNQYFDFNSGTLPSGWTVSGSTSFSAPCGASPSNTPYYWASTATGTPGITTAAFDVSCGGSITFDMVYAVQGGGSPCEGPDEQDEGVELQYSTDGGLTWFPIIYYSPGGFTLPSNPGGNTSIASGQTPYTTWNTFNVAIPPGAVGVNTMFQWTQANSSGSCCDNWGLENIIINSSGPPCGSTAVVNWSNGLMDTTSFYASSTVDTAFVAYVYDTLGNYQCQSDTIFISIAINDIAFNLVDFAAVNCPLDSALVTVMNVTGGVSPYSYSWSNGSTVSSSYLNTLGVEPDTILYYVDVMDECGYVASDSVTLLVSQELVLDSLTSSPQINCQPNGSATAYYSGNLGAVTQSWTGPGNPGAYNSSTSTISNVPTGWYFYTVSEGGCWVSDSVFVDSISVNNLTYNLVDYAYLSCPQDSAYVQILNIANGENPYTFDWSNGSTLNSSYLNSNGTFPDTITYYVDLIDVCGFVTSDSVLLVVNQSFTLDSLTMQPQINCDLNGAAQAYVSGNIGTVTHSWTGPGNPGAYNSSNSTISSIPFGWYYYVGMDGGCVVSDSIYVVHELINNVTYDLVDYAYVYCPYASTPVQVLNIQNAVAPVSITWSNGSVTNPTFLSAGAAEHDSITFYVDIVDACGFAFYDSVTLVVNKLLSVDAVTQSESAACAQTGVATAQVSGVTGTPIYEWADSLFHVNNPLGSSSPTIQWSNISSGWYYFTVTDDVCEDSDSIFVEVENPPIASFTATPDNGCSPVDVLFVNYSQNTTTYEWDFGNGIIINVNNSGNQNQTYTASTIVTLTAYTNQNCASSTSLAIEVIQCGCTDPDALNYNPNATLEDGSCTYPPPVVIAPNIFTPNGDGVNDYFEFDQTSSVNLEVIITNRWGNVMFEQSGINPAWTGLTPGGNPANEGTYFYQYVATGKDGFSQVKGHGFLQLVRD